MVDLEGNPTVCAWRYTIYLLSLGGLLPTVACCGRSASRAVSRRPPESSFREFVC